MVVYERVEGSSDLIRAYSDQGLKIAKEDGVPYDEAIDSILEDEEEISVEEALAIIIGEDIND